jgi:hypothetical protein
MKIRIPRLLTLGAALLLAPLTATFAQSTWQTVDSLTPWRGRDIVADAAGNFISLAIDNGATGSTGVVSTAVSLSADHGATWQDVGFIPGYALDLAAAPDGSLFATGNRSATVSGRAFLWQSLDQGVTWTVSDPSVGLSTVLLVTDVAAGNTDAVYVCGASSGRWMVRKGQRTTSGITWSTVDNPSLSTPSSLFVRPGTPGQPDEVLACGGGWTVRRSINSGATWATVDNYSTGMNVGACGVTGGPDGSIYVVLPTAKTVGTRKTGYTTEYGWQVRKSSNGGTNWANVEYLANANPYNITADASGRVFVVGIGNYGTTFPQTWLVRGSIDGGATWITTDWFLPAGTTRAQAMGIASDAFGNVCVIGETGTTASTYTAPIRRLAAP